MPPKATSAEKAQLAQELGVDSGDYTAQELAFLKSMVEDDSCNISDPAEWAKAGERITNETAAIKQQISQVLGVSAKDFTLQELVKMRVDAENETPN